MVRADENVNRLSSFLVFCVGLQIAMDGIQGLGCCIGAIRGLLFSLEFVAEDDGVSACDLVVVHDALAIFIASLVDALVLGILEDIRAEEPNKAVGFVGLGLTHIVPLGSHFWKPWLRGLGNGCIVFVRSCHIS
jgi:hypothetical protein